MDNILETILKRINPNLTYEELSEGERDTLLSMAENLTKGQLSLEDYKNYVQRMKYAVETELAKHDLDPKQDLFLKARLRNLMLLEVFLLAPEKAKAAVDAAINTMKEKQGAKGSEQNG